MNSKGIWTSEFWLAVLSQAVPIILNLWGFIPDALMVKIMVISGILAGIYTLARTIVKWTKTKADDVLHNKLIKILKPIADKLGIPVSEIVVD